MVEIVRTATMINTNLQLIGLLVIVILLIVIGLLIYVVICKLIDAANVIIIDRYGRGSIYIDMDNHHLENRLYQ